MKAKTYLTEITLVVCMGLATAANAHGARDGSARFEAFDADGNGQITLEEIRARGAARFAEIDANGDGAVSADELKARMDKRADRRIERMIDRLDTNADGALSQSELTARRDPAKMMERFDTDASGGISAEEFAEARKAFAKRRGGQKQSDN